ncbi:class I SAM-dependent methyltransferase [Trichocoleus sp. ST-U3]|uniref:class I SAM-dependent methyltransferase n=1 Tax=Coleofasciculus sp. FACHB-542 TaxID=2692787 RepID=UPI001687E820|nr:class I SAM-dependent methyltransferase [Coleofasciculus sp. FACHB-542]MBD2087545.1 class I SAM-dependent methyltransferase [Coleofasciculus sp. FACHB-542]
MSLIGDIYSNLYKKVCGTHPHIRFWHFQWLAVKDLYSDLKRILPTLEGRLLDVGCGDKPYSTWINLEKVKHIGIDIYPGSKVDIVIDTDEEWLLETSSFDAILCTQVLEHTANLGNTIEEITRVLKTGGILILTVPFIYNEHGTPDDYRRFSVYGLKNLIEQNYEVMEAKHQGGIGSTVGALVLNWLERQMNLYKYSRILKGVILPLWIFFCMVINLSGWLIDYSDRTQAFYSNALIVAKKKCG